MRLIPTGRPGATGPAGPIVGLATILTTNPLTGNHGIQGGFDGNNNGGAVVTVLAPVGTVAGDITIVAGDKTTLANHGQVVIHTKGSTGLPHQALFDDANSKLAYEDLITSQVGAPAGPYQGQVVIATGPPVALYLWDMTTAAYIKVV